MGGDIAEYVINASDKMTAGNYNEMDGLVFAQLSYTNFEDSKVSWTRQELEHGITVRDFAEKMLNSGVVDSNSNEYAFLDAISKSNRYADCTVNNLAACDGNTLWDAGRNSTLPDDAQWAAMTINMNDGTDAAIVSMRGTASEFGWQEDLEIGFEPDGTTAQKLSRDYLSSCRSNHIYETGHSKGGNDVMDAYMMSDKSVRDRVVQVNNYDGPGNNAEFNDNYRDGFNELAGKQKNYYPKDSTVGQLLEDAPGEHIYVDSNSKDFFGEHDAYSWEMDPNNINGLSHTEQSLTSDILNRVLDSSLSGMSAGEKAVVINALINAGFPTLIDSLVSGKELDGDMWNNIISNIIHHPFRSLEEMWATLNLLRNMLWELNQYKQIKCIDFFIPGAEDFIYWLKGLYADFFRNFKNEAEDSWNNFWNGVYNFFTGENNEYHGVHHTDNTPIYDFNDHTQGEYAENVHVTSRFSVDTDSLIARVGDLQSCSDSINSCAKRLNDFKNSLSGIGRILAELPMDVLILKTKKRANETAQLSEVLNNCAHKYINAENNIVNNIKPKGEGY